ncbi:MAG: BspA family leucine-rich repeat surface protein [Parvibaculaceae bacterium]|nr:BspA family leucine-rich repeat surface protein [Parvibaculaceae bacterium]
MLFKKSPRGFSLKNLLYATLISLLASCGGDDSPADTTKPILTLNGESFITIYQGDIYNEEGASAVDDRDGVVSVTQSDNVDTSIISTYIITYTATDRAGNTAITIRTVNVVIPPLDVSAPIITLNGNSSIKLIQGDVYTEEGATAIDDRDGEINVNISGSVDTNTANSYNITYTAIDSAGNISEQTRDVQVVLLDDASWTFVTTWKTDNSGGSEDNQIMINTEGSGYDYQVYWGDGLTDKNVTTDITHTYQQTGVYTVTIRGDFPRIYFYGSNDNDKILTVEQWGDQQWLSMESAFYGSSNLTIEAKDTPDLSQVTNMNSMFAGAKAFNGDLSNWDVSTVTDMSRMFAGAQAFNSDLSSWDVSAVTNMSYMFSAAIVFDSDLDRWDVSAVTDMSGMFNQVYVFNRDLSSWDVSSVTNMYGMFERAFAFNGDLSSWDVSAVTDMTVMFLIAISFNSDLSSWNVSSVTRMSLIFFGANTFNGDLGDWEVSSVTDMTRMLEDTSLSTANYDSLLIGWSAQDFQSDVDFGAGNSTYSSEAQSARDTLMNAFDWDVSDGGWVASN